MAKNLAFMRRKINTRNMNVVLAALSAVVDAAAFSRVDKEKLVAPFQNRQSSDDDDGELSAPPAASYEGHSSDILMRSMTKAVAPRCPRTTRLS